MRLRFAAPWSALIVVLVGVFAYSVGAQTVIIGGSGSHQIARLVVKAVPEGRDIRSFHTGFLYPLGSTPPPGSVTNLDVFTVPAGKVFVITDLLGDGQGGGGGTLVLFENGVTGAVRARLMMGPTHYGLTSGIPFGPGTTLTAAVATNSGNGLAVTLTGYLADA